MYTSPSRSVVLFVWGFTEDDATRAEADARQHASWHGFRVVRTIGRLVGGPVDVAERGTYAEDIPVGSDTRYGRVWALYQPRLTDTVR
jgi:hypothetical protein